ncbi:hypothetical protein ULMS_23420 [Patiriisocius marinistellae]|uniref:DUF2911 domain-containing protein n=2 Tax=Patiriisocius marinistellae TaxID=2494560 RepID=A0A5J4G030_9FLAO|nr:hypothetical protein ULMS_23420 [Patiriisocius marinistellae]
MKNVTKKHSPEQTVEYRTNNLTLSTTYSSPSKKGRIIFGKLVPYNQVWRTGANEATTFSTNKNLLIDGELLPAGVYTLWTIPGEKTWKVIFNKKQYEWGVTIVGQKPSRKPEHDALITEVTTVQNFAPAENFTIKFVETQLGVTMIFSWDKVAVPVSITVI